MQRLSNEVVYLIGCQVQVLASTVNCSAAAGVKYVEAAVEGVKYVEAADVVVKYFAPGGVSRPR